MLIFGPSRVLKELDDQSFKVLNLSSAYEYGYSINNVIPPLYNGMPIDQLFNPENDKAFDLWFINYIFSPGSKAFVEFFSIIMHIYNGDNVFVLIDDTNEVFNIITESVIKIIQQRYGINSLLVADFADLSIYESEYTTFSIHGLYNFDQDRMRYAMELNLNGQSII